MKSYAHHHFYVFTARSIDKYHCNCEWGEKFHIHILNERILIIGRSIPNVSWKMICNLQWLCNFNLHGNVYSNDNYTLEWMKWEPLLSTGVFIIIVCSNDRANCLSCSSQNLMIQNHTNFWKKSVCCRWVTYWNLK